MLGQSSTIRASSSSANGRVFVYEVEGLRQNDRLDRNSYPLRNSGKVAIQVPYSRMNEEMRRITRLGGTIVGIHSLEDYSAQAADAPHEDAPHEDAPHEDAPHEE